MLGGTFGLSTAFLNECVPLWFTLLMMVTAPYMWSNYAKRIVESAVDRYIGDSKQQSE